MLSTDYIPLPFSLRKRLVGFSFLLIKRAHTPVPRDMVCITLSLSIYFGRLADDPLPL